MKDELDKETALKDEATQKLADVTNEYKNELGELQSQKESLETERNEVVNMVSELFTNFKQSAKSVASLSKFLNLAN